MLGDGDVGKVLVGETEFLRPKEVEVEVGPQSSGARAICFVDGAAVGFYREVRCLAVIVISRWPVELDFVVWYADPAAVRRPAVWCCGFLLACFDCSDRDGFDRVKI